MNRRRRNSSQPPDRRVVAFALLVLLFVVAGSWWFASGAGPPCSTTHGSSAAREVSVEALAAPSDDAAADARPDETTREALSPPTRALESATRPPLALSGLVLGPDLQPAIAATVWTEAPGAPANSVDGFGVTDVRGHFELRVQAREFTLHACGTACGESARTLVLDPGAATHDAGTLFLPRGGTIRGRVLGASGGGLRGIEVQAWARTGSVWQTRFAGHPLATGFRRTSTDENGDFELAGLRTVEHDVVIPETAPLACDPIRRVERVLPDTEFVRFEERADALLRAQVVDERTGEPLTSFRVAQRAVENAEGRFEERVCGESRVQISAEGFVTRVLESNELHALCASGAASIELHRPATGTLRVLALDPDGAPVPAPRVRDRQAPFAPAQENLGRGVVVASGIPLGVRRFYVDAPGWTLVRIDLRIEDGRETATEVTLERGERVHLRVLDPFGLPAREFSVEIDAQRRKERDFAWVYGASAARNANPQRRLRTNCAQRMRLDSADGWISGLPAGAYTLIVYVSSEDVREFAFDVSADEERSFEFSCPPLDGAPKR